MEDNYISNLDENNDVELEIYEKYESLKIDFEKLSNEMNDLKKENLEQKHHIQDLEIDNAHKTETVKNQEGLIKFYKQYRSEHEESSLEKKFAQLEEQIKSLKESVEIKNKKLEDLNKELQDQIILNEKLVNVITNKEEIIKKLEKGVNPEEGGDGEKSNIAKLEEEIDQLKERISDLGSEKDKIIDKYEDKMSKINKENNDYQDKIYNYETEILNLKESIKKYEIDEAKTKGGEEAEKEVEKLYKEEIESLKNALNDSKESKKQLKENAQKQRDSDVKEIMDLEQTVDELRKQLAEAKRNTSIMELQKKNSEEINEKLLKRNKELENVFGDQSDKDVILNNYKSKLDKKNNEIENLTAKCKEFKENLDQYEKEKEDKDKEFQHQKEVLQSEIDDKSKKLEVALRELNEIRAKEGKGEANLEQMSEDPKQKLYDEIKELKKQIEEKDKEMTNLKNKLANFEIDKNNEIEAQTAYLNSMIEGYQKNIESLKAQRSKAGDDYKAEFEKLEMDISNYKCQIATIQYESDKKLMTYKNYVRKLQTKLESLGFKFKDKKNKNGFERSKTVV